MQEFYINKGATLPLLCMEIIDEGRNNYTQIYDSLQNASVTFTMVNQDSGITKIAHKPAYVFLKENETCQESYYIGYIWRERDTNKEGIYKGTFEIIFSNDLNGEIPGRLTVPIKEELKIFIQ